MEPATFCILCSENILGRIVNGEILDLVSERREQYCLALVLQLLGINPDSFFDVVSDWGANGFTFCKPCGRLVHRGLLMIDELKRLKQQLEDLKQQVIQVLWRGMKPDKLQRISYSKTSRDMLKQSCKPCTVKLEHVQLPARNARNGIATLFHKRRKIDLEIEMPELDGPFYSNLDENSSISGRRNGSGHLTAKTPTGVPKKRKSGQKNCKKSKDHLCSRGKIFPDKVSTELHVWKARVQTGLKKRKYVNKTAPKIRRRKGSAKSPKKQSGGGANHRCLLCNLRFNSRSERVQHHWDVHVNQKNENPVKIVAKNSSCLQPTPDLSGPQPQLSTLDNAVGRKPLQTLSGTFHISAKSGLESSVALTVKCDLCGLSFRSKTERLKHSWKIHGRSTTSSSSVHPVAQLNGQVQQVKRVEGENDSMRLKDRNLADPNSIGLFGLQEYEKRPTDTGTRTSETICAVCNIVVTWDELPSHVSSSHDLVYTLAGAYACQKCGDCYEPNTNSIYDFQQQHRHAAVVPLSMVL